MGRSEKSPGDMVFSLRSAGGEEECPSPVEVGSGGGSQPSFIPEQLGEVWSCVC